MIKGKIHQKDITVMCMHPSNRTSKCRKLSILSVTTSFHIWKRSFPSSITRLFSGRACIGKVEMYAPFFLFFTNFWNNKLILCICQQIPFIILLSIWTHELNILDMPLFTMFFSIFFCIKYVNNYLDLEGIIMKGLISKRLLLIYRVL